METKNTFCNFIDTRDCGCSSKLPAAIRRGKPNCERLAVIPAVTVETTDGITNLADCFVHVTSINTTFYLDDKHRIMVIWAGPVEVDNYDFENNPLKLRSQDCYTTTDSGSYYLIHYDAQGNPHVMAKEV